MPGAASAIGAVTSWPPSTSIRYLPSGSLLPPTTPRNTSSAPNPSAWRPASRDSSAPPMPPGKPKKFSILEVCPAWPPGTSRSSTIVERPSDAAYTAAARPAGPAPTITMS